jgi:hypothetical protein
MKRYSHDFVDFFRTQKIGLAVGPKPEMDLGASVLPALGRESGVRSS